MVAFCRISIKLCSIRMHCSWDKRERTTLVLFSLILDVIRYCYRDRMFSTF